MYFFYWLVLAQTLLVVPDTLVGPNYTLTMHKDSVGFFKGKKSNTYAFNNYKYLGPTLIFNKNENVNITVKNLIDDTTTVHWHGLHLPSKWDGGPYTPIMPNTSWSPHFKIMNNAATYWYHPHMHMKTAEQAIKGAAGLIIIRDSVEASLALPRKYGVDDFPIIVQCQQYDTLNQAMPLGMQDSTLLVNGSIANNGNSVIAHFPAQIVRMRLLNASGERVFNFGFTANKLFHIIASDNGLLNTAVETSRIRLAPGERAEILIDLNGMNGQALFLMSYASEMAMGIQGGPTMPMPNGPPMNSPLNGIDFNIMQIKVAPQTVNAILTIPASLTTNIVYSNSTITRTIRFTADSAMVMDGPFYFNDSSFDMMRIDYEIPLNNIEKWKLVNETMVAHPFHIHDVFFYLIDRNGQLPPLEEQGRKDVVLVPPYDSVIFITKFDDFADSEIPYMFHCHILMHEDAGMMGNFLVIDKNTSANLLPNKKNAKATVSPNPSANEWTVNLASKALCIQVFNSLGQLMDIPILSNETNLAYTIQNLSLPNGIYYLQINDNNNSQTIKLIKI